MKSMIEQLKSLDWKEITKSGAFWISMAIIAVAISSAMSSCFNACAKSDEARYKYHSEMFK